MIDFSQFDSLISMTMYFNNEDTCKQAIIETRWGVIFSKFLLCFIVVFENIHNFASNLLINISSQ